MNMRAVILVVISFFSFAPMALALIASPGQNGAYCAKNLDCQSNNCDTSAFFSFNYKCVPSTQTATKTINGCPAGTCTFSGDCSAGLTCAGTTGATCSGKCSQSAPAGTNGVPNVQTGPGGSNPVQTGPGGTNTGQSVTLLNPLQGGGNLESFLNSILAVAIRIGTIIVILMMVYVGFLFVAARGEPGEIIKARQALLWTVVGALILLGAQVIAVGIQATVQALSVGG